MIPLGMYGAARFATVDDYTLWTPDYLADGEPLPWSVNLGTWTKKTENGLAYIEHMQGGSLSGSTYGAFNSAFGSFADVDVIMDILGPSTTTNVVIGPSLRMQTTTSGYSCRVIDATNLHIIRQDVGVAANNRVSLTSTTVPTVTPTVRHRIRFRAVGDLLQGKLWQRGDPEPSGWAVEVTDSTFTSGYIGVSGAGRGSTQFRTFTEFRYKEVQ